MDKWPSVETRGGSVLFFSSLCRWTGFLSVIALPFLVVSLCEVASDSEHFVRAVLFPNAHLNPSICKY